jgi:hypothetical protein
MVRLFFSDCCFPFMACKSSLYRSSQGAERSDTDMRERMKHSKNIQQPQNDANHDDRVQNGLDASRHGNETIHEPEQNPDYDQDDHKLNEGHDGFFSFFARRRSSARVADSRF